MEDQILRLLGQFISFQTIDGNNPVKKECLDWVETAFFQSEHDVKRAAVNECPYLYVPHTKAKLLWFAHLDVVPADQSQFTVRYDEAERKIYGRGVMDMKGPALPFLIAFKEMKDAGHNPPVSILLTTDEETAGRTIPVLLDEGMVHAPAAFTPDTGTAIVTEHKGVIWAELIALGEGGHASQPWKGLNPIDLLMQALEILKKNFPTGTNDDWHMTVTPTQLSGSQARNQIPDSASASIDIRFVPQQHATSSIAFAAVQSVLPAGCALKMISAADPLYTDPQHHMVQLVRSIAEDVTGETVQFRREHGGTDARYFSATGIPAFLYGPQGGGIHGKNEWVSLDSLVQQVEFARRLLAKLTQE